MAGLAGALLLPFSALQLTPDMPMSRRFLGGLAKALVALSGAVVMAMVSDIYPPFDPWRTGALAALAFTLFALALRIVLARLWEAGLVGLRQPEGPLVEGAASYMVFSGPAAELGNTITGGEFKVSREDYDAWRLGDRLCITVHIGRLHMRWWSLGLCGAPATSIPSTATRQGG